jgi:hypothetical protein
MKIELNTSVLNKLGRKIKAKAPRFQSPIKRTTPRKPSVKQQLADQEARIKELEDLIKRTR